MTSEVATAAVAAADLSESGHHVRLWRRAAAALQRVIHSGAILLKDADGSREVRLVLATADIALALRGAQLIVIPSPAVAQADIARAMAPHLVSGQVVFPASAHSARRSLNCRRTFLMQELPRSTAA